MSDDNLTNPFALDPQEKIIEATVPAALPKIIKEKIVQKPVHILYFTDPLCVDSWGIEAQLRRLNIEYGDYFSIEYVMGGLLPDLVSQSSQKMSNPTDVAAHWDEAATKYEMPIDGDVWRENPVGSSYPACIGFKAAQLQDENLAHLFLRKIKEMVFVEKKNIAEMDVLCSAAETCNLDVDLFKTDYQQRAFDLFQKDLEKAENGGIHGFPTLFFMGEHNKQFIVYGVRPYDQYVETLKRLADVAPKYFDDSWENLFTLHATYTTREFCLLTNKTMEEGEDTLNAIYSAGKIDKYIGRNGNLWKRFSAITVT